MRSREMRFLLFGALLLAAATPARATFHIMLIEEIYAGHPADPGAHLVVLQMLLRGQNLVGGHPIHTFFPDGTRGPDFGTFTSDVSNVASGTRILMATPEAVKIFGVPADHVTTGRLPFPSGRVCFAPDPTGIAGYVDCVAYGSFTGANTGYGTPATALVTGQALRRTVFNLSVRNNSTDFALGSPRPANSLGAIVSADGDADLVPDTTDCAPADPSLWFAPPEVTGVQVALDGTGAALLRWESLSARAGTATLYDLVLGSAPRLNTLRSYGGVAVCGARELLDAAFTDAQPVDRGDGRFYLIRGRNGCGFGTYGNGDPPAGTPDPRDLLDDPLTDPCR